MLAYTSAQLLAILQIRRTMNPKRDNHYFNLDALCKLCELKDTYGIKFEELSYSDMFARYYNPQCKLIIEYAELINGTTNIKYTKNRNIKRTLDDYHSKLCKFIKDPVLDELSHYVLETSHGGVKFISKDDELSFIQKGWLIESKIDRNGLVAIKSIKNTKEKEAKEFSYNLTIPTTKLYTFFEHFPEYRELDSRVVEMVML